MTIDTATAATKDLGAARAGLRYKTSFVPDDEVYEEPVVEVREPDPKR